MAWYRFWLGVNGICRMPFPSCSLAPTHPAPIDENIASHKTPRSPVKNTSTQPEWLQPHGLGSLLPAKPPLLHHHPIHSSVPPVPVPSVSMDSHTTTHIAIISGLTSFNRWLTSGFNFIDNLFWVLVNPLFYAFLCLKCFHSFSSIRHANSLSVSLKYPMTTHPNLPCQADHK